MLYSLRTWRRTVWVKHERLEGMWSKEVYSAGATTHCPTRGLSNGSFCLTVLEATSPGWRYQQAGSLLSPFSLACRRLPFSLCPHMVFFLCTHPWCLCVQISSYKDTSHVGLGPSSDLSTGNDPLKALSPFMVIFWDTGVGCLWILGDTVPTHNRAIQRIQNKCSIYPKR